MEAFKKEGSIENLKILLARAEQRGRPAAELTKMGAIVDVAVVIEPWRKRKT